MWRGARGDEGSRKHVRELKSKVVNLLLIWSLAFGRERSHASLKNQSYNGQKMFPSGRLVIPQLSKRKQSNTEMFLRGQRKASGIGYHNVTSEQQCQSMGFTAAPTLVMVVAVLGT